jgi:hypothetical protein
MSNNKLQYTLEEINHRLGLIEPNKNLLPYPYSTDIPEGLEDVGDGSILTTDVTTPNTHILLNTCSLPAGEYTVSLAVTDAIAADVDVVDPGFSLEVVIDGQSPIEASFNSDKQFSLSAESAITVYLNAPDNFKAGLVLKPQIEEGEKTDWAPFMKDIGSYVDERFNSTNAKIKLLAEAINAILDILVVENGDS